MDRAGVIDAVADHVLALAAPHPLRVGIDGMCGAGKTTFRRALADRLRSTERPVVELDSDGFHHPRAVRYRQGRSSARGYYEDAYDFGSLEHLVLRPLGPDGNRRIALQVLDLGTDEPTHEDAVVPDHAVVLFDCTFLQRGTLRASWDVVVFLTVEEAVARARGIARDADALGGAAAAAAAHDRRYLAACRIYEREERPRERATLVVDNTDLERPRLLAG